MDDFAISTGLSNRGHEPRRYLWTDAFAVCNYLGLYRQNKDPAFLELALKLVDQVHHTLGQHRADSIHKGWLSGLDDEQAQKHPTVAGLRIGKPMNERSPGEPLSESMEWEQDGQYFHYLTKWMHALNCVSHYTGKGIYNHWAMELARVAYGAFTYVPTTAGPRRMYWKMSIDLSRPLVETMGQHDPLDGLITYQQLEATAKRFRDSRPGTNLSEEINALAVMCAGQSWSTRDPLGIGGLMTDAHRLVQLIEIHHVDEAQRLEKLLGDIDHSLQFFDAHNSLNMPAGQRLAFRELGLSIGLHALHRMRRHIDRSREQFINANRLIELLGSLARFHHYQETIERFWSDPVHRSVTTWREHEDINSVMLAASLTPDGYLNT